MMMVVLILDSVEWFPTSAEGLIERLPPATENAVVSPV